MVEFEYINSRNQWEANWRWKVDSEGRYYSARNKMGEFLDNPFNFPYNDKPLFTMNKKEIEELQKMVSKALNAGLDEEREAPVKVMDGVTLFVKLKLSGVQRSIKYINPDYYIDKNGTTTRVSIVHEEIKAIEEFVDRMYKKVKK